MTAPAEHQLRLSFAKPLKSSDPRSRGQHNKNHSQSYYNRLTSERYTFLFDSGYMQPSSSIFEQFN